MFYYAVLSAVLLLNKLLKMKEYWTTINLELDTDLKYEVSSYGNIRRILKNGNYRIINSFESRTGSLLATISISKNGKYKKSIQKNVNTLVLKSFYPDNYYYQRKIKHIDNDKKNCKLKNLEWASIIGFKKNIDIKYVKKLSDSDLDYNALMIKKYLIFKKDIFLMNMIENNLGITYLVFKDYKMSTYFKDYLQDCFIKLKLLSDKGGIMPINNLMYMFFRPNAKNWIKMFCKKQSKLSVCPYFIKDKQYYTNCNNYEISNFKNISEEINEMFGAFFNCT